MRLIDADALIESVNQVRYFRKIQAKRVIDSMPTVDAVPVRHGKWTPHEEVSSEWNTSDTWYRCACGYDTQKNTPYCPMCGARMDDGTD